MAGKKTGKRLLTWVLVLVMALSLLPLNVLAANSGSGMNFDKQLADDKPDGDGNYTIQITAQATGTTTTTTKVKPMDIVLVLDQSGSMADDFNGNTTYNDEARRQYAMKEAVNSFIGEVVKKYGTNADHRMAIVTFDSDAETLASWTAVDSTGAAALTNAISNLLENPSGATNVGAGMELAQNLMDNDAYTGDNRDRQKTVIVFTDGVPTTGTRFNVDVANKALEIAQSMKNDGVSIYTIGVFSGADIKQLYGKGCNGNVGDKWGEVDFLWFGDVADVDRPAGNRFLNYLSSNFKNANKIGLRDASWDIGFVHYDGWRITENFDRDSSDYYKTATDASDLANIFEKIATTVPEPVNSELDEKTVITDTLSDYFTFATGTAEDVKVSAKKSNGDTHPINLPEGPDGIDVKGKTVTVTGYNFSEHYQGIGGDDEEKLVIEIKVKPNTSYTNWGESGKYETNKGNATVTHPNIEEPIAKAASPKAHVNTYKVTYQFDKTAPEGANAYLPEDNQYYISGQTADVKQPKKDSIDEGGNTYTFDGWKNGEDSVENTVVIDKADVELIGTWTETANKYKVTYEYTGTIPTDAPAVPAAAQYEYGAEVTIANVPTLTGYTFHGWTLPEGLTENGGKFNMPAGDVTITGYWTKNTIPTYTFDLSNLDTIKVNKEFKSKYGRSATMSFTATATIEKQDDLIVDVGPILPNNRSAANVEPTYYEATGTVTLKTDKTDVFKFDKTFKLEPGAYRITVQETNDGDRYVTYDTEPYTRYFTVSKDGEISPIDPITITNMYTKRHTAATPSKPTLNTGDHYAYVMGYPDGTVRPNGSITRAEVSAILFRLLSDKTRDEYFTTESSFTDVKAGAWYNNSIATLEKAGVIVDTAKGGAFRPNEAITRAELAAMLAQFSDAKPVKGVKFSDVSAEHWAYEAIAIAAKMGWIEGYPDGTFRPDATITRAEMMTLVNRALERVPSDEDHLLSKRVMLTFPDCKSGDWFYIAVQEATNSHTYERAATEKNGDEQWTALRANRDWTLLEK